ncbi:hypothetical protein ACTJJ7_06715 [Phyllobacterium sp. 22229]
MRVTQSYRWDSFEKLLFNEKIGDQCRALPAYGNEIIITIKSTSLASTVTVMELTGVAKNLMSETYAVIEVFCMVAAIYLALNVLVMLIFKQLDNAFSIARH